YGVEVIVVGGCRVGDYGERRLQRMSEVARMAPRLFGLRFAVGEKLVDLLRQRPNLDREIVADARLVAGADVGDLVAHAPQWPKPVEGLQTCEDQQPDAKRQEAP